MKTLKWSTTLVILASAATLFSAIVFFEFSRITSLLMGLAALALLLVATLRGKPGV